MNGNERWLKCAFSKEGKKWPQMTSTLVIAAMLRNGNPDAKATMNGNTRMFSSLTHYVKNSLHN